MGVRVAAAVLLLTLACSRPATPPEPAAPAGPELRLEGGLVRRDLRFECTDAVCAAWLYAPAESGSPAPAVVMGHGFAGTRDVGLPAFAEACARRGVAAVVFDYRGFGASGGSPRQLVDPWRQLEDWRSAVGWARAQPELDAGRIALLGASLGAGHALLTAAGDPAVRAVVAVAPLVDTTREGDATFPGVAWAVRLVVTGWIDLAALALGRGPVLIPAIAPSGGFGMIVDDAAHAAFERLVEPGSTYRNEVVAHSAFTFDDYDPSQRVAGIAAPILAIASRADRFAPFAAVDALAEQARDVTVEIVPGDHFDVYATPVVERAAGAACAFLAERLRAP